MKKNFFAYEKFNERTVEIINSILSGVPTSVSGLSDSIKFFYTSLIRERVIYITRDAQQAKRAAENISSLSGERAVYLPAKDDVLLYKNALSKDSLYGRINALFEICEGARYVCCDIESAMQLVPYEIKGIRIVKGEEYDFQALPGKLTALGYSRASEVESKGTFAVRGDILDVYPINYEHPLRIDFFGDSVDSIRPYNEYTKERYSTAQFADIVAATDAIVEEEDLPLIEKKLKEGLGKSKTAKGFNRMNEIAEEILSAPFAPSSADFVMPLLKNSADIFTFLGDDAIVIFDDGSQTYEGMTSVLKETAERCLNLSDGGEIFPFSSKQLLDEESFKSRLVGRRTACFQTFANYVKFFSPLKTYNVSCTPVVNYMNDFSALYSDVKSWLASGYRVLIFCGDASRAGIVEESLLSKNILTHEPPVSPDYLDGVTLFKDSLDNGFIMHEEKLVFIGSGNIFLKRLTERRLKKKRGDVFSAPEAGDYAVHEVHGIGKVRGTKLIETLDGIKEYIAVEYYGGDMLYVPVEQTDILTKYTGGDQPKLSKIGGQEFEKVKAKVRESLKKLAFDLKYLYSEREKRKGYQFPPNEEMMDEFAYSFPYTETPDQTASIKEIISDMTKGKLMDRLLCGDVGFGKTEVALRAIYLCVLAGKQAALMCPSTILSQQHYSTACERFKNFGVRVEVINRFKTAKQQKKITEDLEAGKIDLIVGTHRLLSKDIKFKDLGLLVLDEEQRFGVEHKEILKTIKNDVDCLTMSATPIPRTLHMSLSGIRDISTIDTPPEERIPVQTYVVEESETVIRDACIRELARGGQIFVLYNRVETISRFAAKLKSIVPEAVISIAHGKMEKSVLEKNVDAFYNGESNVLVTTTIIENGIDLPNANTIIVIDSDYLGISQLYQLRGRVGRGSRMAHAYFTYKPEKVMTAEATERLKAIMEFTRLGSGFKIAMRDLQIRGAGNVLGAEQHGHMDKVGYELYAKLLKEEITGEEQSVAELEIALSAFIPEKYIESPSGRMDTYKQIAEIRSVKDYNRVEKSLEETYGKIPREVYNLLLIAVLKSYASKFYVRKIIVNKKKASLEFSSLNAINNKGLMKSMDTSRGEVSLSMVSAPALEFKTSKSVALTIRNMINFLKYAEVSRE